MRMGLIYLFFISETTCGFVIARTPQRNDLLGYIYYVSGAMMGKQQEMI